MNALNIFLATSGFIITMLGVGLAIIRGAEWAWRYFHITE
jgi:hypothetical protein